MATPEPPTTQPDASLSADARVLAGLVEIDARLQDLDSKVL